MGDVFSVHVLQRENVKDNDDV